MSSLVALICIVILFSSALITMSILHFAKVLGENNRIHEEAIKISQRVALVAEKNLSLAQDSFKLNQNYLDSVEEKNIREIAKINKENQYLSLMIAEKEHGTSTKERRTKTTKKENNQP